MAKSTEKLLQQAVQIRDEQANKKNTALRVGTLFSDIIEKQEESDQTHASDVTKINESINENKEKLTELERKNLSTLVDIKEESPIKFFNLEVYRGQTIEFKIIGVFGIIGYYKTDGSYEPIAYRASANTWVKFAVPEDATVLYLYNMVEDGDTTVKVFINPPTVVENTRRIDNIEKVNSSCIINAKKTTVVKFSDLEVYRGQTIEIKAIGIFGIIGYYKTDGSFNTIIRRESANIWASFYVPEDATNLYVYNMEDDGDTTVKVFINPSTVVENTRRIENLEKINSVYVIEAKKGKTVKFSGLEAYRGQTIEIKVSGVFGLFGYYKTDGSFESITNKTNANIWIRFTVPEDATTLYIYNMTDDGDTTVKVCIKSPNMVESNPDIKGCVFMSFGDSITTETYYIQKLRKLISPSKYYNLAVAGAHWADYEDTIYDGNPMLNGPDNNKNNVIGNQLQKIINNPDTYNVAPDVIIIAAGTNDVTPISPSASLTEIKDEIETHFTAESKMIPISNPTFDESDTYKEHRRSIAGAMRYVVCKLQELYPNATIYILTPIQACYESRYYGTSIAIKQSYISECAKHLGLPIIHVGEECGIHADFEYNGAMWTGPTGTNERSGRDLVDGLHPNENGGWKMAKYIAKELMSKFIK